MRKRRSSRKPDTAATRTGRRRMLAMVLVLSVVAVGVILGQHPGPSSQAPRKKPRSQEEGTITPASFDTPSKEYIYGPGGRILATEEPSGGGTPGQGNTVFDFEPDGKTEIGYYSGGVWGILKSSQQYSYSSGQFFGWGNATTPPFTADFDGDHKADLAYVITDSGSQVYSILKSSTSYDYSQGQFVSAGFASLGDTPVVGNFDSDALADPSFWRSSSGVWFLQKSSANYVASFVSWGQSGDIPIVADFDGDGLSDIGFYRNGLWEMLKSSQNYSFANPLIFSWGGAGLQPVVADFDNDKKADIGYIVPPTGGQSAAYAILKSSANYSQAQPLYVPAGYPSLGDTPVVGDYDGDGKADPGIWRASQGVWIIPTSSSNYTSYIFSQWGQQGDIPIHSRTSQN